MHLSKLAVEVLCRADHTIKNVDLPKTRDRKKGLSLYELLITTNTGMCGQSCWYGSTK